MPLEGKKIVSAREMARVEKKSFELGYSASQFMSNASRAIAQFVVETAEHKQVTIFVGKGNNGGDAAAVGCHLLKEGFEVTAYHLFKLNECSSLCQEHLRSLMHEGGEVYYLTDISEIALYHSGSILDGLLGTGFEGRVDGFLAEVIEYINASPVSVVSIDIPSGINGNTGEVSGSALIADDTLYLELPKIGLFLGEGYAHAGGIHGVSFGLPKASVDEATALGYLCDMHFVRDLLPVYNPRQHKYQAGYVVSFAGMQGMSGAAFLSSYASLRAGAGIARLFYHEGMSDELAGKPWEVIATPFDLEVAHVELQRAGACLFGPGMEALPKVKELMVASPVSNVIDAGALQGVVPILSECQRTPVLTPHRGELRHLIAIDGLRDIEVLDACQEFVERHGAVLLLKGAPSYLFAPEKDPLILPCGNPGMATAGSGDVLSGIIAALLAQNVAPREAAALGAILHGKAGDRAAEFTGEHSLTARDMLLHLPYVLRDFQ